MCPGRLSGNPEEVGGEGEKRVRGKRKEKEEGETEKEWGEQDKDDRGGRMVLSRRREGSTKENVDIDPSRERTSQSMYLKV